MAAPTPPGPRAAEREPRPRRNYRAMPMVLAIVLLAINVGLTGRIAWRLERQPAPAQPPTLAEIIEGLTRAGKAVEKGDKRAPAPTTRAAFAFDTVAVLPFSGPDDPKQDPAAKAEADKLGPALSSLLAR